MEELLKVLYELRDSYRKQKHDAQTREYSIYYRGAIDGLEKAIKKLES